MKNVLLVFIVTVFIIGCGYKPSSHYAKSEIGGLVYTDLNVNIDSAQSSVLLKDSINHIVLTQLGGSLTSQKADADTIVYVKLAGVSHKALTSDDAGYAKSYRTTVSIHVKYNKKDEQSKSFSVSDYYDYSVSSDATLSDQIKDHAIRSAVEKALQELLSKLAVSSFKE